MPFPPNTNPRRGAPKGPKAGSVSPKHRGFRPDAPGKDRWNADERAARRGGEDRGQPRADRRPDWIPPENRPQRPGKAAGAERRARTDQNFRTQNGGRPSRDGGDRSFSPRDDRGGYQPRDDRGGYQPRDDRGGYQGRDDRGARGSDRGGYQGRDTRSGGDRGFQPRDDRGGYQGRDNRSGGNDRGGFQSREARSGGNDRGGYQGRDTRSGGDRGFQPREDRGGYQPRDNRSGGSDRGGYQGRDTRSGGNDRSGYQPRDARSGGSDRGGYQGRDTRSGGNDRGGYQGRDDRGGQRGGYAPRDDRNSGGDRGFGRRDDRTFTPRDDRAPRQDRDFRSRDDRPARDDRAPRSFAPRDDRAPRSGGSDRPWQNRDERPSRDERPARQSRFDRDERPSRDTRPARGFDRLGDVDRSDRSDRGNQGERSAEPRQSDFYGASRPAGHVDDVVLERLEATATTAEEVDGVSFGDLGLGSNIVRTLGELGAERPFPIQAATIPDVLAGLNVLGRGRTGSGKTIAFGAPLVERLMENGGGARRELGRNPRALILAPTRELALQIDRTIQPIARSVGLFTTQIYGGVPQARQVGALKRGVDIIIGTPGRLEDLEKQGHLNLSSISIVVLDEADHMCDLGFLEPVQRILRLTRGDGQRLLFSATLDSGVATLVDEFLPEPSVHEVAGEDQASSTIDHRLLLIEQRDKVDLIAELSAAPGKTLVFARTRAFAEQLAEELADRGVPATSLHGDLNQARRTRSLERLTSGKVDVLVATDVAARGIHVDDIGMVIQADAPEEYKTYLHRAGRTGRAGKQGTVVTLIGRNRRRKMEELLARAEIEVTATQVAPGDATIRALIGD